jgi:NADPH:quinone reductase-like Zn-dependent oxidoreductase
MNVLIYGASTSVGLYAAQMVRISARANGKGIRLFGVASKARWDLLMAEPYYYDHLVDYRDDDWHEQIQKLSGGEGMHYIYDAISEGDTVHCNSLTLAPSGRMALVRSREGGAWTSRSMPIEPIYGAVWEGLGEEVHYQGLIVPKSPSARGFAARFYNWLSTAVATELKPVSIRLMPGGLDRIVEDGFTLLGSGRVAERQSIRREQWMRPISAEKLIYKIRDDQDSPGDQI